MDSYRTFIVPVRPNWQTLYSEPVEVRPPAGQSEVSTILYAAQDGLLPFAGQFPHRIITTTTDGGIHHVSRPYYIRVTPQPPVYEVAAGK